MSGSLKKEKAMQQVYEDVLACSSTELFTYRTENGYVPVIGGGSLDADIVFVGEAPGKNEAMTGKPFVGAAGKILDSLLEHAGLRREDVYITSIVKDRPPKNRDPFPAEIAAHAPFLDRQIDIIQPKVLATLGRFSMVYLMEKFGLGGELLPISQMHGRVFEANASYGPIHIVPLYHPAAAIYNQKLKDDLKEDIEVLRQFI
jgi:uracil-DNA glycosylase